MHNDIPVILLGAEIADEMALLTNMLIGQGYRVEPLSGNSNPIDVFRKTAPDVLVLALSDESLFPKSIYRKLRMEANLAETPLLVVLDPAPLAEPLAGPDGFFDCVFRPYERDTILARTKLLIRINSMNREIKTLREQLQGAQRFECVGALAAGVAHEFNNLMCSVMGFAELAIQQKPPDIELFKESAEVSYETAKRAAATSASLLAFSRQVQSVKARGDVNDAVRGALRLLQRDLDKNEIKADLSLGPLPKILHAQGPLQQVFLNLIINASHAMNESAGQRLLSIKSWCEGNSKIHVSIADTGRGIEAGIRDKIFDPFYTTKTGNKPGEIRGSGLGLVIVKEVVKDHNGMVRVESEAGKGARFTVTLPVDTEDESRKGETGTPTATGDGQALSTPMSILIIDDEDASRRIISRVLQRQGHDVYTASTMAEAVALRWNRPFDLIVLDLIMPNSDGADNVEQLRDHEVDVPILICTGNTDTNLIQKALDAGARGVVTKPFSIHDFQDKMRACMEATTKP